MHCVPMKEEYEYVCTGCNKLFSRAKTGQDHAEKHRDTHPLGKKTPMTKRVKGSAVPTGVDMDAHDLMCEFITGVQQLVDKLNAGPELKALSKRLEAALRPPAVRSEPDFLFALEPLPPKCELKRRLLDIFKLGVIPHLVWTHVTQHGTVRKSEQPGHLQVYGDHGWTTLRRDEVARLSVKRMQTRIEKMWLALVNQDPKAASVLRPAMLQFVAKKTIFMDSTAFDLDSDGLVSPEAEAAVIKELAALLHEYTHLL